LAQNGHGLRIIRLQSNFFIANVEGLFQVVGLDIFKRPARSKRLGDTGCPDISSKSSPAAIFFEVAVRHRLKALAAASSSAFTGG
jgi:hypothetical protein